MTYIYAKQIILPEIVLHNAYLEIRKDGTFGEITHKRPEGSIIKYEAATIAPGLIDTHIHGYMGFDVMDNKPEAIREIAKGLLSCGVTSWLATTLTASREHLEAVCQTLSHYEAKANEARLLGIFLEGPFFSEHYKGAQNASYMKDPSLSDLASWLKASNSRLKKIALAPERKGALPLIEAAKKEGLQVGLAHSAASYEEACLAVQQGADIFIHTFNGMSPFHHRKPGMVGAAMSLDTVYTEVIADGHHVHPAAIKALYKCRGASQMLLVSDCMRAGGLPDGPSYLGDFEVEVKEGIARLSSTGSLAGSTLRLIDAVRNIVRWDIAPLAEAIRMASLTPAESLNISEEVGQIKTGLAADFIVLDEAIHLIATYRKGQCVYEA